MTKQFWAVIVVIALIFLGIFFFSGNKNNGNTSTTSSSKPSQHVEGEGKSGVTLVEYGDYECPYCEEYFPTVKEVQAQYNDQIYFQFRNFPLTSIHPNAFAGARAAEAASLQGYFWQMHDELYTSNNWEVWSTASDPTPYFDQYAKDLGLNVSKFESDFASTAVNDTVNADMAAGNKLNIQGTPTFFLDGKQISPAPTEQSFDTLINAEIAKKTQPAASTTTKKP